MKDIIYEILFFPFMLFYSVFVSSEILEWYEKHKGIHISKTMSLILFMLMILIPIVLILILFVFLKRYLYNNKHKGATPNNNC